MHLSQTLGRENPWPPENYLRDWVTYDTVTDAMRDLISVRNGWEGCGLYCELVAATTRPPCEPREPEGGGETSAAPFGPHLHITRRQELR